LRSVRTSLANQFSPRFFFRTKNDAPVSARHFLLIS
jgi:hypothetical protein